MGDFKIPPLSTLVGSTTSNFIRVIRTGRVELRYYHKILFSFLVTIIGFPFRLRDKVYFRKSKIIEETPIFIIGHWRSGTTLLHNLLCQDQHASYISTYQSLFPHNLRSKWLFKSFVRWKIPDTRPSDNVKLGADLPQEDDFAMSNCIPAFYTFFFFPENYKTFYNRHVKFTDGDHYAHVWLNAYNELIIKARRNVKGEYSVLKNPVNTARIKQLLEKYPKARFIHIYRNPVDVYLSTKRFFLSLYPTVQLQTTSQDQIIEMIFNLYRMIMKDYFNQKRLIPQENLIEMAFEDFEVNPIDNLRTIYEKFNLRDWEKAVPNFRAYLATIGTYEKNKYQVTEHELDRITNEWGFAFEKLGYPLYDNIEAQ